jgi:hypothetical protein
LSSASARRGTLALFRSAQALALIEVTLITASHRHDVKACHNLALAMHHSKFRINNTLRQRTREAERILQEILLKVAVPV